MAEAKAMEQPVEKVQPLNIEDGVCSCCKGLHVWGKNPDEQPPKSSTWQEAQFAEAERADKFISGERNSPVCSLCFESHTWSKSCSVPRSRYTYRLEVSEEDIKMIGLRFYLETDKFAANSDLKSWLTILESAKHLMENALIPGNLELLPIVKTQIFRVEKALSREAKAQNEQDKLNEILDGSSKRKLKKKMGKQRKSKRLAKNAELSIQSSLQDLDINISNI